MRTQLRRDAGEVVPVGTESPTHLDVADDDDDDGHTRAITTSTVAGNI